MPHDVHDSFFTSVYIPDERHRPEEGADIRLHLLYLVEAYLSSLGELSCPLGKPGPSILGDVQYIAGLGLVRHPVGGDFTAKEAANHSRGVSMPDHRINIGRDCVGLYLLKGEWEAGEIIALVLPDHFHDH